MFNISENMPFAFNEALSNYNFKNMDLESVNSDYYKKVKKLDKSKWYYFEKDIDYIHNEYGYRSDLISDIQSDDYLLTFGCSYSYGYGLFYEDTYSYKLSKKLGLKNINLSVPGTGLGFHIANSTLFLNYLINKNIRLPKYVIIQYPSWSRLSFFEKEIQDEQINLLGKTASSSENRNINAYYKNYWILNAGESFKESMISPIYINNMWKSIGVPIFHIDFGDFNQDKYKSNFQNFSIVDYSTLQDNQYEENYYELARDLSHNGKEFHNMIFKDILNKIKNG